jgi:outer membrane protein assembly factor BamB
MTSMKIRFDRTLLGALTLTALLAVPQASANWPNWRGPEGNGVAPTGTPPTTWSETENVKWKVPIPGTGQSTPVIWGDKIILLTASELGGGAWAFDVVCMDRTDGTILWKQTAAKEVPQEGHHPTGSFAPYSAVTDGKFVWASFGSRGLHCYDLEGKHQWSKPLDKMTIKRGFGEGSSPLLVENAIIILQDHEGSSRIGAYDKATGDLLWEKSRDEKTTWTSPMAVKVDGKTQIVVNATNKIRSYDLATGDVIWECGGMTANVIPTPVFGNGLAYCASGFRGSALSAIKLDSKGDVTGTDSVAWTYAAGTPYVPSPLLYGDRLFFLNTNTANLTCIDAKTGEAKFERAPLEGLGTIYASPVGAGGHIYIADREGKTAVVEQSDSFKSVAVNTLEDSFDATPVVVGNELYLRGSKHLYCIAAS